MMRPRMEPGSALRAALCSTTREARSSSNRRLVQWFTERMTNRSVGRFMHVSLRDASLHVRRHLSFPRPRPELTWRGAHRSLRVVHEPPLFCCHSPTFPTFPPSQPLDIIICLVIFLSPPFSSSVARFFHRRSRTLLFHRRGIHDFLISAVHTHAKGCAPSGGLGQGFNCEV